MPRGVGFTRSKASQFNYLAKTMRRELNVAEGRTGLVQHKGPGERFTIIVYCKRCDLRRSFPSVRKTLPFWIEHVDHPTNTDVYPRVDAPKRPRGRPKNVPS